MNVGARRRQGGFALVLVLWTLGFLSLLGTLLVATARQNTQRLGNLLDAAVTQAAAEAGLQQAIFRLLDSSNQRWGADGTLHVIRFSAVVVEVRIEDDGGKVNPNIAPLELLQALMLQLGVERGLAASLAGSILDWRGLTQGPTPPAAKAAQYAKAGRDYAPPSAPFESLDELSLVLGMSPDLLARLRPHLTLYTTADPDISTGDPVVAAALGAPRPRPHRRDSGDALMVATVQLLAHGAGGSKFAERVTVRTNALSDVRRFEILARQAMKNPQ
jgi:general secretion pathway protein K